MRNYINLVPQCNSFIFSLLQWFAEERNYVA